MQPDRVICQSGAVFIRVNDFSERHKSEFYQRLEPVANAENQAVATVEQPFDRLRRTGIAHEGFNELCAALGFVSAGETAGNEQNL